MLTISIVPFCSPKPGLTYLANLKKMSVGIPKEGANFIKMGVTCRIIDRLRLYPDFSASWVGTFMPYKREADSERLLEGLRKAGLSE